MAASEMGILGIARVTEIFDALQDIRQIPGNFAFSARTPTVPATDADIIARFFGQAHVADIVGPDQKASTYAAGRIKFEQYMIPAFKFGMTLSQEDMRRLGVLEANPANKVEGTSFEAYFAQQAMGLLTGLRMRKEMMIVGMFCDSFAYNRNGMVLNINWGTLSEFKLTVANAWTDATNATPFTDITNQALIAKTKYGKVFDRATMSFAAFRLMTRTAEFQNQLKNFIINAGQPYPQLPLQSRQEMLQLAARILGIDIELYDTRYPYHPTSGAAPIYTPVLPLNLVVLSCKADDNDPSKWDWADGLVEESVLANLAPGQSVDAGYTFSTARGGRYGPYSYVSRTPDLNPPTVTWWGVQRGMPRKKDQALCSIINVGTVTDFIAPTIPF